MNELNHQKRILLIEDQAQFYTPITRWLQDESYHVTHAASYFEAKTAVHTAHFHLAIVDLNLDNDDPDNEGGFELLQEIQEMGLDRYMPCVMLTAHGTMRRTLRAFQDLRVAKFIPKETRFRRELLTAVEELFDHEIKINFDLDYDEPSTQIMAQIAHDINWSMTVKPDIDLLTMQVLDLFGSLFVDAVKVEVSKLIPGLTGAAVIRVQPTWSYGKGTPFVVKIGREEKVRTESERYEEYVKNYLPPNTIAQVKDVAYTRHIGGLLYTFTENDMVPLKEFDEFYATQDVDTIISSLKNLFETTCLHWYEHSRSELETHDLAQLYFDAFRITKSQLIQRIHVILPNFDPTAKTFHFEQNNIECLNPINWLESCRDECKLPIFHSITHGDLTGRNIMVDQTDKCWLIDFYRTHNSHIMRDFVIMETDLKYRLMPKLSASEFFAFEKALLAPNNSSINLGSGNLLKSEVHKAFALIVALRSFAIQFGSEHEFDAPASSRREQLISLLMATLNVVRLRHIPEDRKLQAMLSAALICTELDRLEKRPLQYPALNLTKNVPSLAQSELSQVPAQLRHVARLLVNEKLNLFVGAQHSEGFLWPAFLKKTQSLGWKAIFTSNRHTQLESAFAQFQLPHRVVTHVKNGPALTDDLPIYKFYGTQSSAGDQPNGRLILPDSTIMDHLCHTLHNGQSLLLLCATESEIMMIYEACQVNVKRGSLWLAGANLPEDKQDRYRSVGFRVLPESQDEILDTLKILEKSIASKKYEVKNE